MKTTFKALIIVAAMLLVLMAVVIFRKPMDSGEIFAKADLSGIRSALEVYKGENGFYPTTEQGMDALVNKPESSPIPQRWTQHLQALPKDPWQRPYVYRFLTPTGPNPYVLFSLGPDGVESKDDIY